MLSLTYWCLTPKVPRPISYQKTLKIAIFIMFAQENRKKKLESNHRILYFTYLGSSGKNLMKFDYIDLNI